MERQFPSRRERHFLCWALKRHVVNGFYSLMKSLSDHTPSIPSLYVKSLVSFAGPEYAIRQIFERARQTAPCLLIFEDLDSLVTDQVRSYFLNEVDGLESNDGILMVGSTNHRKPTCRPTFSYQSSSTNMANPKLSASTPAS